MHKGSKFVIVMGIKYSIKLVENPVDAGQSVWGYTDYADASIILRKNMARQKIIQTLVHELTHIMLYELGMDEKAADEAFVTSLGNVLYQVIKDNKLRMAKLN